MLNQFIGKPIIVIHARDPHHRISGEVEMDDHADNALNMEQQGHATHFTRP
jgi:hypothetical protein